MDKSTIIATLLEKKRKGPEAVKRFIEARIQELNENSEETTIGFNTENPTYKGFIGENVKINMFKNRRSKESDSNHPDSPYKKKLSEVKDALDKSFILFDGDDRISDWIYGCITDTGFNDLQLIHKLTTATMGDGANSIEEELRRSEILITNALIGKDTNYSEIKNRHLCVCTEFAILLHNTFLILGYSPQILFGVIEDEAPYSIGFHAFNILKSSPDSATKLLVDLSNPYFFDENGQRQILSAMAVLDEQKYQKLINGEKIRIDMAEIYNQKNKLKLKPRCSTYGIKIEENDIKKQQESHRKKLSSQQKQYGMGTE